MKSRFTGRSRGSEIRGDGAVLATLKLLPFITKQDIRHNFPQNFLGPGADLESLVEDEVIELEHTSGTSEQHRTPLLLPSGWWAEQERRALQLNPLAACVLTEFPNPRRVTISSPVCNSEVCFTGVPSMRDRIVGDTLFVSLSRFPFLWAEADLRGSRARSGNGNRTSWMSIPVYGVVFALYCQRQGIRFPVPALRFGQLRVCQPQSSTNPRTRLRGPRLEPVWLDRNRAPFNGKWCR